MTKAAVKTIAYRRKTATERRQELVRAGITCLGKGGMTAFTIDQICTQAGVSRGLINHHFKTKEELLVCIYEDMTNHLVAEFKTDDPHLQLKEIVETSFDERSFDRDNLRAWLSIWGEVATNAALSKLHRDRYQVYKTRIARALSAIKTDSRAGLDADSIARQLIALIDGLWLEYCLHSTGFTLAAARTDCYHLLRSYGVTVEAENR